MLKPNVILLTIDTLRADRLGCYGCPRPLTPNLDRLAEEGIHFSQAISGGSWTQAAFPVLLTSTYASMYGGCLGSLSLERPSPIEALADFGYTTVGFSTSPLLSRAYGYERGFHHFVELVPHETDPLLRRINGGEQLLRHSLTHHIANLLGQQTRPARPYVSATKLTAQICRWLDGVESPFFCWAHYMDIHWPYHLEEVLKQPRDIAQAWRDLGHLYRVNRRGDSITPAQRNYYIELYERAVSYTDTNVGHLLNHLDNLEQIDNTIVIVVADHGEEFLERQHWGHVETNLYDEIVRVPLIIRLPGRTGGQVVQRQVGTLDIMPTILDLCDCHFPLGMEGHSLVPLWNDNEAQYEGGVTISERWRDQGDISHIIAVRTDTFKYIYDVYRPDQPKLYDLRSDPDEKKNVSTQYPDKLKELHAYVDEHLQRAEQTRPDDALSEPQLDEAVIQRLRHLGYVE